MTAEPEHEMSESAPPVPSKSTRRQARQAHAIALLIGGHTQAEVAQAVGIHERTLRRWLSGDQEFRSQLNAAVAALKDELITRTVSRLGPRALDVLERGVQANHQPESFKDQLATVREINRVVFPQTQGARAALAVQVGSYYIRPTPEEIRESDKRIKEIEIEMLGSVISPELQPTDEDP